jgi:hypothetical protein
MPEQSGYRTWLNPSQEREFQAWFTQLRAELGRDLDANDPGYDMRGYWRATQLGAPGPRPDPSSGGEIHFPDTFKTPQHPTMSNESIYAPPGAPHWNQSDQLVDSSGRPTAGFLGELLRRGSDR